MTQTSILIPDADFSADTNALYLPGFDLLTPYWGAMLGTSYGAPSNGARYDWTGNTRTLVAVGTPTQSGFYLTGGPTEGYQTSFSETAIATANTEITVIALARNTGTFAQQIFGNLTAGGVPYASLFFTDAGKVRAQLNSVTTAEYTFAAGEAAEWAIYGARWTETEADLLYCPLSSSSTTRVEITTSGQSLTSANEFHIGTSEGPVGGFSGTPDIAAIFAFDARLSNAEWDQWRDQIKALARLYPDTFA